MNTNTTDTGTSRLGTLDQHCELEKANTADEIFLRAAAVGPAPSLISMFTSFTLGTMSASTATALRLDAGTAARVDRVAVEICKRAVGVPCTRSAALRLLVVRGLDVLEHELGLSATPPPSGSRSSRKTRRKS